MGWIIYISGFIVTYSLCKWIRSKAESNNWEDVYATFGLSIFSWMGAFFIIACMLVLFLKDAIKNIKGKNPPKWL